MLFICLNFVDFILILLFFPETKGASRLEIWSGQPTDALTGKTLEEMNKVFGDEVVTSSPGHSTPHEKESVEKV